MSTLKIKIYLLFPHSIGNYRMPQSWFQNTRNIIILYYIVEQYLKLIIYKLLYFH